jgi:hypothetical protein
MKTPPGNLKSFANRLAHHALSQKGAEALHLLRNSGLLENSAARATVQLEHRDDTSLENPDRIGIWERKKEGDQTYFVRNKEMARHWNFWANVGKIGPKKAKYRVILIGESVARGFLYDPLFTPAIALQNILQSVLGAEEVEVVDLARTNLGYEVKDLAVSALQLDPDIVIIFCGNNWDTCALQAAGVSIVDTTLREHGVPGLKAMAEKELALHVARLVSYISTAYREKNVPLIWMIPEFNLGDWRDPITNAPYLPEGMNLEWITLREGAENALRDGDLIKAARLAQKIVELDQATSVTPFYILAECSQRSGELEATRKYLELARDAVIWDTSKNTAPRTYSSTERALGEEVAKHSDLLVDLPLLFKEYLNGGIPDRRLFVDYCHLSSEGIQIAMAAAASCVLRKFKGAEFSWQALMERCALPLPEIEAEASFLAAVHNSHWFQSYELIHHYCRRAVASWSGIAQVMSNFVDLQTRRSPMFMCRAAEEISSLGSPLMQRYLLRFNYQRLDGPLLEAIVCALENSGTSVRRYLNELRRQEHSVSHWDVDLLDFYYCSEGLQQQEIMWTVPHLSDYLSHKPNHYYKAYWLESRFAFVGDANSPVDLRLTCRLAHPALYQEDTLLYINGKPAGKALIGSEWSTWEIQVPGNFVQDGINTISIKWPVPNFPGLKPLEDIAADLTEEMFPEFFCVFGEIHTFVASRGQKTQTAHIEAVEELSTVSA